MATRGLTPFLLAGAALIIVACASAAVPREQIPAPDGNAQRAQGLSVATLSERALITRRPVPTLELLSPRDGDTITPPTAVRYKVARIQLTPRGVHIEAFVRGSADNIRVRLQPGDRPGLAYLPANKLLTGRRDLTFALTKSDGTILKNPEARVTIYRLTIKGGR